MNTFSTDYATWGSGGSPIVFTNDTGTIPNYTYTGTGCLSGGADTIADTITISTPDPLIDWLPYHYKKYLPTWHLVRSYQHE